VFFIEYWGAKWLQQNKAILPYLQAAQVGSSAAKTPTQSPPRIKTPPSEYRNKKSHPGIPGWLVLFFPWLHQVYQIRVAN
jgi:hypothetical protein